MAYKVKNEVAERDLNLIEEFKNNGLVLEFDEENILINNKEEEKVDK